MPKELSMSPVSPNRSPDERNELAAQWNAHPGMKHMGAVVEITDSDEVKAVIDPIEAHHRGGLGTDAVNGALIAGMFDLVIGLVGFLHAKGRKAGVAQLNIQFLRPAHGDRLEFVGRPVKVGQNLIFVTAELTDEKEQICARCDGIMAVSGSGRPQKQAQVSL